MSVRVRATTRRWLSLFLLWWWACRPTSQGRHGLRVPGCACLSFCTCDGTGSPGKSPSDSPSGSGSGSPTWHSPPCRRRLENHTAGAPVCQRRHNPVHWRGHCSQAAPKRALGCSTRSIAVHSAAQATQGGAAAANIVSAGAGWCRCRCRCGLGCDCAHPGRGTRWNSVPPRGLSTCAPHKKCKCDLLGNTASTTPQLVQLGADSRGLLSCCCTHTQDIKEVHKP